MIINIKQKNDRYIDLVETRCLLMYMLHTNVQANTRINSAHIEANIPTIHDQYKVL